tara:strand:- start:182 stop:367 length:186 start_codon:yes stop_codon:yes gene_type:complete
MTKQKKIKIGDKTFIADGDTYMEENAHKNYIRKKETAFNIGGTLSKVKSPEAKKREHEQRD